MKTSKLFIYLALLFFLAPTVTSCSDDDDMDIPGHTIPPKAVLSSDKTSFEALTGAAFVLEASVTQGYNVQHEWKIGDMVIGQDARLEYAFADPGTFEVVYSALNGYGADRHPFTVVVSQGANPGITFSTDQRTFERSIGEMVRLSATLTGITGTHSWKVDNQEVSTSERLDYSVATAGTKLIKHTLTYDEGTTYTTQFTLTAVKSDYGNWFKWREGKDYVICLKNDLTKVVAADVNNPAAPYNVETWDGSQKQLFRKGYYFGYGPVPALEYYNFYNVATHSVLQWTGNAWPNNPVDPVTGAMGADPWDAWFMDVNASGDVRFMHFFALWDSHPNPSPDLMSSCLTVTENGTKIGVYSFYCCGADGRPDFVNYQALGDKYFEFKMIAAEDMPQP